MRTRTLCTNSFYWLWPIKGSPPYRPRKNMKRHSILLLTLCAQALNTLACPFLRKESDGGISPHRALKNKGEDKRDKDHKDHKEDKDKDGGGEGGPGLCKKTSGLVVSTAEGTCSAFNFLTDHFYDYIPRSDPESNEIKVARSRIQGVSVRFPFHDGAEFDKNSDDLLGPDGEIPALLGLRLLRHNPPLLVRLRQQNSR